MNKLKICVIFCIFICLSYLVDARAGGGCFLAGTLIQTENGPTSIEELKIGDIVLSFDENLNIDRSAVDYTYSVLSNSYFIIKTSHSEVRATAEHPFLTETGYIKAEDLMSGETVFILTDKGAVQEKIISITEVNNPTTAYNLGVDKDHTFIADDFFVHNKGGGGGGGGGSHSSSSSRSSGPPPNVFYYDCHRTYENNNQELPCCKQTSSKYYANPNNPDLFQTASYPYCLCSGVECVCTNDANYDASKARANSCPIKLSDIFFGSLPIAAFFFVFVFGFLGGISSHSQTIRRIITSKIFFICAIIFYIISFIGGLLVLVPLIAFVIMSFIFFMIMRNSIINGRFNTGQWSSTISVDISKIAAKSQKTSALLSLLSKFDTIWDEEKMKAIATNSFYKMEECWQKRDYAEMTPLMMPSLLKQHTAQLESMKQSHEINKLDELKLIDLEIILVKNKNDKLKDEFTVWLKAQAKDTIIDDRTGKKIRGDTAAGVFEEFWTYQRQNKDWKVRQIDQPEEAMDFISEDNYDENATDMMKQQIYSKAGKAANKNLSVSSVREQVQDSFSPDLGNIKSKTDKISRLLNFLSETDKIWSEQQMREQIRECFILVYSAIEQRKIHLVREQLTLRLGDEIENKISALKKNGQIVQKRNLAIRNMEIVLVRNYNDKTKDEFIAWVSGQAQTVIVDEKSGKLTNVDPYVKDFEEYFTFKRNDQRWLLDSIEEASKNNYLKEQNIDEGTSKGMMDWYYSKNRTV
jgi:predicted lipid-binding transport protein (Tim44 family)